MAARRPRPHPRCGQCDRPAKWTFRERHPWGDGPYEQGCATHTPPKRLCVPGTRRDFWQVGKDAERDRQAAIARTERRRAA